MNRPLKRKIENAILDYLNENKAGTIFASLPIVGGHGTNLAADVALDADAESDQSVTWPETPYLAIFAQTRADEDLPNCSTFEIVAHYKHDATAPLQGRYSADEVLRAITDQITCPPDEDELTTDGNAECGAFIEFANIDPNPAADDERAAHRRPLHVYGMWPTTDVSLFDDTHWHDQVTFAGHAQDIDSRDPAA